MEIFVLHVFEGFFVGGNAFKPTERRDHAEEEMEFGVFRDERLLEDDGFSRVESGGEIVGDNFDSILRDGGGVRVVARERMPVGDEVETFICRIVLQADPVLQRAKIVADVKFAGRPHSAENSISCFRSIRQVFPVRDLNCKF